MRPRNSSQRGITFLEVMVVMVVLGIMLAIVIPNMAGPRESAALRSAARDISGAGLYARQQAITYGEKTYLIIRPEDATWRIHFSPPDERSARRSRDGELEPLTSDEQLRNLPARISFQALRANDELLDLGDEHRLIFYPNGTCTGLAVQVANTRDRSLTIDFEAASGIPEIYVGEPKSFAQKLREHGLNPADYGLEDDLLAGTGGRQPGEGFYRSAGWNEEERVQYYEDAVERMLKRAQARQRISEEGPAAYYAEASRWGR